MSLSVTNEPSGKAVDSVGRSVGRDGDDYVVGWVDRSAMKTNP